MSSRLSLTLVQRVQALGVFCLALTAGLVGNLVQDYWQDHNEASHSAASLVPAAAWLKLAAAVSVLRFGAMAALGGSAWVLVVTQITHAVTFAAHHAACIATVDRHFQGGLRGRGQALYSTIGYGASGVVGGLAGGAISGRWGFPAVFAAAAAMALGGLACYALGQAAGRRAAA